MPDLLVGLLLLFCGEAYALVPDVSLGQLNHRVFTVMEGAPSDIDALAQGADGTLWIGGRTGLSRFDGRRFVRYPGPRDDPLQSTNIASLFAAPDGVLWIGFRPGGVSRITMSGLFARVAGESRFREIDRRDSFDPVGIILGAAPDGRIWAAADHELIRIERPADPRPEAVAYTNWRKGLRGLPFLGARS
jgi:ligand-binding sensor domain-containing protein